MISLLFALSNAAESVNFENVTIDHVVYALYDDLTASVVSIDEEHFFTSLVIPDSVLSETTHKNYSVISVFAEPVGVSGFHINERLVLPRSLLYIGKDAFSNSEFTEVILYDDIISMGTCCFSHNFRLKTIRRFDSTGKELTSKGFLPEKLEKLSDSVFMYCTSLSGVVNIPLKIQVVPPQIFWSTKITKIIFHDNVIELGSSCFLECHNLIGELQLPYHLITLGDSAFSNTGITKVTLPDQLEKICDFCFENCTQLRSQIFLPDAIELLGQYTFCYTNIASITFSKRLVSIGENCFYSCKNLTSIQFPDSLQSIGPEAFSCTNLNDLTFFNNLTKVSYRAFAYCKHLKWVVVYNLSVIELSCFEGCTRLESIKEVNNAIIEIRRNAFESCTSLSIVSFPKAKKIESCVFKGCTNLTEAKLDSLIEVSEFLFQDCINLKKITFCQNITINSHAFLGCSKLNNITNENNTHFLLIHSFAFEKCNSLKVIPITNEMEENSFFNCCKIESLEINTNIIAKSAISWCSDLTSVYFGNNVWKVSYSFFDHCQKIVYLSFDQKDSNTELLIEDFGFANCASIVIITDLPNRTTRIGESAFYCCTSLSRSIIIPRDLVSIGPKAFENCINLNGFLDFSYCENLTSIGKYAFMSCIRLKGKLILPISLKVIEEYVFFECLFTGPLIIPNQVQKIKNNAFYKCTSFSGSLVIGSNVFEIGDYAFAECHGIQGIQIQSTNPKFKKIGACAFYGCQGMKCILNIPNSIEEIGDFAFFSCLNFSNTLTLPQSIKHIGISSFAFCSGFTGKLVIPSSVETIGDNAFFKCTGINSITFDNKINQSVIIGNKAFGSLHIKCLTNVPKTCQKSIVGQNCYDTDNFNWIASTGSIGESCSTASALEIIILVCTSLASLGILNISFNVIYNIWSNRKTTSKRLLVIIKEIIEEKKSKNLDSSATANSIINALNERICEEAENPEFKLSSNKVKSILGSALDEVWMSIPYKLRDQIIEQSLNDLEFDESDCLSCSCFHSKNSKNKVDDPSADNSLNSSLLI